MASKELTRDRGDSCNRRQALDRVRIRRCGNDGRQWVTAVFLNPRENEIASLSPDTRVRIEDGDSCLIRVFSEADPTDDLSWTYDDYEFAVRFANCIVGSLGIIASLIDNANG